MKDPDLAASEVTPTNNLASRDGDAVKRHSVRHLKSHKKSRRGCPNCKQRKVKCDEKKPSCNRCNDYGTFCNYDERYAELQPLAHMGRNVLQVDLNTSRISESSTVLGAVNGRSGVGSVTKSLQLSWLGVSPPPPPAQVECAGGREYEYGFVMQDLELLHKFRTRTIFTLGSSGNNRVYRDGYCRLAYSHPFLLHIILTVTMLHDQYLSTDRITNRQPLLAFHWSRGAALLNATLSTMTSNLSPSTRDAVWASAGLLGALSFSYIHATTPEEAWPLKLPSSSTVVTQREDDHAWLHMSEGKKAIWEIADPLRSDSLFQPWIPDFFQYTAPLALSSPAFGKLGWGLRELCGLDAASSTLRQGENENPYLTTASFLAQTMDIKCSLDNFNTFLGFFGCMDPVFKSLLVQRDPCALLLLAHWYALVSACRQWWIWRRADLECRAICKYLRDCCKGDWRVVDAVGFPERVLCRNKTVF